jgi:hypothetical protein
VIGPVILLLAAVPHLLLAAAQRLPVCLTACRHAPALLFPAVVPRLSPAGRALLVAGAAVSASALVYYWRSLAGRERGTRYRLMGLRALTLLLTMCALAGLSFEYRSAAGGRILLVRSLHGGPAPGPAATGGPLAVDDGARVTIAALQARGFEVVEAGAASAFEELRPGGAAFSAAIVSTDERLGPEDARREVERAGEAAGGAPVYVVTDLTPDEGPRVTLEEVTIQGRAMRGVPLSVRCLIHARRMQGRESLVTISDEAKTQAAVRVSWKTNEEWQTVMLEVVPKVAGWTGYSARVEAAGAEEGQGEQSRPFNLYAEERRLRVLFFEGEPTWEGKFIRRALEQSGLFEVDSFAEVSRAATVGLSETAEAQPADENEGQQKPAAGDKRATANPPGAKLHGALQGASQLNAYDCVIVGATPDAMLSAAEVARLDQWVERRGGGLVVLGGNSFAGSIAAPTGKLYPLLPAEISPQGFTSDSQQLSRGIPLETEKTRARFALMPTDAGAGGALSGYLKASEAEAKATAMLTGAGLQLGGLRPGAVTLAVSAQMGAGAQSERGQPLVAAMRYGMGRTLVFAPADSWRIRTGASGEQDNAGGAFGALWQGIVLWAAAGARPPVELALSHESPGEGSIVTAELRVRDASFLPLKIEKLSARLQPLAESAPDAETGAETAGVTGPREIAFAPDAEDANIWRARLVLPERGRYRLEAEYGAGGRTGSVEKRFAVVAAPPAPGPGATRDTLRRLARENGGDLVTAADLDALAARLLAASSNNESVARAWELRTWWPLAFIIPLLLSLEWLTERLGGRRKEEG